MTDINKTIEALKNNGFNVIVNDSKEEAKETVKGLLQEGSEVMQMSSVTLQQAGIAEMINESGNYKAIRPILMSEDSKLSAKEKTRLASVPDFTVGSVHAITQKGELMIVSKTGSQLPAYTYGPGKVIFVVGIQKLVNTLDDAFKRVYDYVLPLESKRAHEAYGVPGSDIGKILIINKEVVPDRITVVLVKEELGF